MSERRAQEVERFEAALREWGQRPPRTPASHAATRIVASLPQARPARRWWRPAWAAAAAVLLAVVFWLVPSREATRVAVNGTAVAPLDDNVVLWWLDDGTPVYFVLGPGVDDKEGT